MLVATAAHAADLATRYGMVQALPASEGSFTVSFAGRPLATTAATGVALSRVTPAGPQEHIVIESWKPALHCHKSYVLLTIRPDRSTSVSPSFGECTEIQGALYLKDGVRVMLRSTGRHRVVVAYTWAQGRLSSAAPGRTPPDGLPQ